LLHLTVFEQPEKDYFFSNLPEYYAKLPENRLYVPSASFMKLKVPITLSPSMTAI